MQISTAGGRGGGKKGSGAASEGTETGVCVCPRDGEAGRRGDEAHGAVLSAREDGDGEAEGETAAEGAREEKTRGREFREHHPDGDGELLQIQPVLSAAAQ